MCSTWAWDDTTLTSLYDFKSKARVGLYCVVCPLADRLQGLPDDRRLPLLFKSSDLLHDGQQRCFLEDLVVGIEEALGLVVHAFEAKKDTRSKLLPGLGMGLFSGLVLPDLTQHS